MQDNDDRGLVQSIFLEIFLLDVLFYKREI
jgi:hypothetical protein